LYQRKRIFCRSCKYKPQVGIPEDFNIYRKISKVKREIMLSFPPESIIILFAERKSEECLNLNRKLKAE
ncbi:MAG: hypothetical protein II441_01515, partial [Oscillospiraceae bacterium]|nr:hypothetical protein [Oscillospiraceae bacterium]